MTSFQVAQWLRQGIAAAQAGDAARAYELLLKVVDIDEYNELAWLWLSSVVETDTDREVCLENVLAINPENKLAKTGLVHLRSKAAQPAPPAEPEPAPTPQPEPEATSSVAQENLEALVSDWWDQPETVEAAPKRGELLEPRPPTAAAPAVEMAEIAWAVPQPEEMRRAARLKPGRWIIAALLVLGALAVVAAVAAVMRSDLIDPTRRDYASAMRPLLDAYEAWWEESQGVLVTELNSLCGPGAEGWRNWDVLYVCSSFPGVDCELLAAHCGTDIDAMRNQMDRLSQKVQRAGEELLSAFEAITPPDDIALAHGRFLACVQTRIADADRVGRLAHGEPVGDPDYPPACQMFVSAEEEVRAYVGSQ